MQTTTRQRYVATISAIFTIQGIAFLAFHLNEGLIFEIEFVKLILACEWPRYVYFFLYLAALYTPIAVFLWMIFSPTYNKALLGLMAAATLYSAYYWQYPLLTGFLFAIGQFDKYSTFLFGHMPGIDQYPPL